MLDSDRDTFSTRRASMALAILATTLVVSRVVYFESLGSGPFDRQLVVNARQYDAWAREGYPPNEPYYQAPLYIGFLSFVYGSDDSVLDSPERISAVRWAQLTLSLGTLVGVFVLALRASGLLAAVVAGGLWTFARSPLFFDGEVLPGSLSTFLLLVGIGILLDGVRSRLAPATPASSRNLLGPLKTAVSGLVLGLAVICRPNFLVPVGLAGFVVVAYLYRSRATLGRRVVGSIAALLIAFSIPIGGVVIRNVGTGSAVITANGGDNLLLGAHPDGADFSPFPTAAQKESRAQLERDGVPQSERGAAAREEALGLWRSGFGTQLARSTRRFLAFFQHQEISNNRSVAWQCDSSGILRWPPFGWVGLGAILPLAALGAWTGRRRREVWLSGLVILGLAASLAPFLVASRLRLPALPWLCLLAGWGVAQAWSARGVPKGALIAAAVAIVLAWAPGYRVESDFPEFTLNRARAWQERARSSEGDEAAESQRQALSTLREGRVRYPDDARFPAWLGEILLESDPGVARAELERAIDLDDSNKRARRALAEIARRAGEPKVAIEHLEAALSRDPSDPRVYEEIGEQFYAVGRYADGVHAFYSALDWSQELGGRPRLEARIALGEGVQRSLEGNIEEALEHLSRATMLQPGVSTYPRLLGQIALDAGRGDRAVVAFQAALAVTGPGALTASQRQQVQANLQRARSGG